jgi:hypothetical protein
MPWRVGHHENPAVGPADCDVLGLAILDPQVALDQPCQILDDPAG